MSNTLFQKELQDLNRMKSVLKEVVRGLRDIDTTGAKSAAAVAQAKTRITQENAKLLAAEERINRINKKKLNDAEKANRLKKEESGIVGKLLAQQKALRQAQKQTQDPNKLKRINTELRKVSQNLQKAKNTTQGWGKAMGSFQMKFNTIGNFFGNILSSAIMRAGQAVKQFFATSFAAADKQLTQERQLLTALNGNARMQQRLIRYASERQRQTIYGDEESIEAMKKFTAAGITQEQQLKDLLKVSQDLAAFEGIDLQKAVKKVSTAVATGSTTLEKYGVELSSTNTVAENVNITLNGLTETVGGQAEVLAQEGLGAWKQYKNAMGDTKEAVGMFMLSLTSGSIESAARQQEDFNEVLTDETIPAYVRLAALGGNTVIPITKKFTSTIADNKRELDSYNERFTKYVDGLKQSGFEQQDIIELQKEQYSYYINAADKIGALNSIYAKYLSLLKTEADTDELPKPEQIDAYDALTKNISNLNKQLLLNIIIDSDQVNIIAEKVALLETEKQRIDDLAKSMVEFYKTRTMGDLEGAFDIEPMLTGDAELDGMLGEIIIGDGDTDKRVQVELEKVQKKIAEMQVSWLEKKTGLTLEEWLGLDDDGLAKLKEGLEMFAGFVQDSLMNVLDMRADAAKAEVDINNQKLSELQTQLQKELDLQAQGAANQVDTIQKRIAAEEKLRQRNLQDLEKAQKQQLAIETAQQAISMTTAVANTIKGFSNIPIIGIVLGLAAAAALVTGFISQKKAIEKSTRAEKGDIRTLSGDRHQNNNGTDGIPVSGNVVAEDGEIQAIFKRSDSRKHSGMIYDFHKAISSDKLDTFFSSYSQGVPNFNSVIMNANNGKYYNEMIGEQKKTNAMLARWKSDEPNGWKRSLGSGIKEKSV